MNRRSFKKTLLSLLLLSPLTYAAEVDSESNDSPEGCPLDPDAPVPIVNLGGIKLQLTPPPSSSDEGLIDEFMSGLQRKIDEYIHKEDVFPCYRTMAFDSVGEITRSEQKLRGVSYNSATLEIERLRVGFSSTPAAEKDLRKEIQMFINEFQFRTNRKPLPGMSNLARGRNSVNEWPPFDINSMSLTWAEEGYTLAPTQPPSPDVPIDPKDKTMLLMSVLLPIAAVLSIAGYLLNRRRRRNTGDFYDARVAEDELHGVEFLEIGGFPDFSSQDRKKIKIHYVDVQTSQIPTSPEDIEEICVRSDSDVSVVSSLGQSEGRFEVTMSINDPSAFPITNLTRTRGPNGEQHLYHQTEEGFDRLDNLADDEWVSDKGSYSNLPRLLRGGASNDSLRYSSDNSQDMEGFPVNTPDRSRASLLALSQSEFGDANSLTSSDDPEYTMPQRARKDSFGRTNLRRVLNFEIQDHDDEDGSVTGILRSIT
ncbi:predicted protein [Chaetoceros tenuissimus]|uniref:Uncharacterized protein n=2 Tax=Chaetoceros tenuissimus TaxID=426638 RepID=A0AAD3H4A4_9STRA|nr:predicted protein [Chaetoceros tenuissimus]